MGDHLPESRVDRAVIVGGTAIVLILGASIARDAFDDNDQPPRNERVVMQCAEAQSEKGKSIDLGRDTVQLAVVAEGFSALEMGTFRVQDKKVTVQRGQKSPEALTEAQPLTIEFNYDKKPIAEVTAEPTDDHKLKVTCAPEGKDE